jgi:uncharacterized membrane protein YedE/YeeE
MRTRVPALAVGAVFGVTLSWTGMTSPNVIRDALLFKSAYLFLFFGSAVATSFVGLRILRARRERAVLVDKPVRWKVQAPQRHHIVGSVVFGVGWGIADACPGPIATQLGQGIWWSVFTIAGLVTGIALYLRGRREVAPASEPPAAAAVEPSPAPG